MGISRASTFFPTILKDRDNIEILLEALEIQQLGDDVVERLSWHKRADLGVYWWQDKQLIGLFSDLYTSGCIILPRDGVDRLRWIALLCVEICRVYDFDHRKIILHLDYLPDHMIEHTEELYPERLMRPVFEIRRKIREQGWNAVFEM